MVVVGVPEAAVSFQSLVIELPASPPMPACVPGRWTELGAAEWGPDISPAWPRPADHRVLFENKPQCLKQEETNKTDEALDVSLCVSSASLLFVCQTMADAGVQVGSAGPAPPSSPSSRACSPGPDWAAVMRAWQGSRGSVLGHTQGEPGLPHRKNVAQCLPALRVGASEWQLPGLDVPGRSGLPGPLLHP